jgi:hypothetical protein
MPVVHLLSGLAEELPVASDFFLFLSFFAFLSLAMALSSAIGLLALPDFCEPSVAEVPVVMGVLAAAGAAGLAGAAAGAPGVVAGTAGVVAGAGAACPKARPDKPIPNAIISAFNFINFTPCVTRAAPYAQTSRIHNDSSCSRSGRRRRKLG